VNNPEEFAGQPGKWQSAFGDIASVHIASLLVVGVQGVFQDLAQRQKPGQQTEATKL